MYVHKYNYMYESMQDHTYTLHITLCNMYDNVYDNM